MSSLTFFYPVLDALSDGRIIRTLVALVLRILGVLTALAGIVGVVLLLKTAFGGQATTETTLGAVLLCLLLLAGTAANTQICFYRSRSVSQLGDSQFTVIPIVSLLFRWAGETYAVWLVTFGIGGCVFTWTSNQSPLYPLSSIGVLASLVPTFQPAVSSVFLNGLAWLFYMVLAAFLLLVLAYFLAEGTLVWVDIARNIRKLSGTEAPLAAAAAVSGPAAVRSVSVPKPAPPPAPAPPQGAVLLCPRCGAPLESGTTFCGNCGAHI